MSYRALFYSYRSYVPVMQIVKIQRVPYVRIQSASSIISHGARFPIVAVLEWRLEHNGMSK